MHTVGVDTLLEVSAQRGQSDELFQPLEPDCPVCRDSRAPDPVFERAGSVFSTGMAGLIR